MPEKDLEPGAPEMYTRMWNEFGELIFDSRVDESRPLGDLMYELRATRIEISMGPDYAWVTEAKAADEVAAVGVARVQDAAEAAATISRDGVTLGGRPVPGFIDMISLHVSDAQGGGMATLHLQFLVNKVDFDPEVFTVHEGFVPPHTKVVLTPSQPVGPGLYVIGTSPVSPDQLD